MTTKPDRSSSLDAWLQWLEELHPTTIELGLERVRAVYDRLGLDFSGQRIVIIGGTNGKGSSIAMLSGILQAAGYSVGCYTSPHLLHYNERVTFNGRTATDAELSESFAAVEAVREDVSLTYFEYGTLSALVCFAGWQPDFILLEVGLGGRLDAVNIVEPELSILTNVALDHIDWLGDTRELIGHEKAGIFRAGKPAVYGETDMPESVAEAARKLGTTLLHKGEHYRWQQEGELWSWQGRDAEGKPQQYQGLPQNGFPLDNAAAVVQGVQFLIHGVEQEHIAAGLAGARVAGRYQQLEYRGRRLVLDVAHNPHAAGHLAGKLQNLAREHRIHLVLAMLGDKDSEGVLGLLAPHATRLYVAPLEGERGAPVKIIYNQALAAGAGSVTSHADVGAAFEAAVAQAEGEDVVVVTGSFFTVAAVLESI